LNWDENVTKNDAETTETKKLRHALEVKYKGFLSPIVENEISVKVEQEKDKSMVPPDIIRIYPIINLSYKGSYWNGGAKRSIEDSNEPGKKPKTTDSYFVEFFRVPKKKELPDLKGKYTLDKDFQEGLTDTEKQGITLSSQYRPNSWLELKGDYNKNLSVDHLNLDSDTEEEKISGTVGIRHMISEKIRIQTEYKVETTHGATLLGNGGATNQKQDQTHTWKNTLGFRPFNNTDFNGSYDLDLKQNIVTGEHTLTKNIKGAVSQKLGNIYELKGDFSRAITEAIHTLDDNEKTDDTWTGEFRAKFAKQLDFSLKYQTKTLDEIHADPAKNTTSGTDIYTATWVGALTPFWNASASYDKTDTITNEVKTVIDTKYSLKSTFDFKAIYLTLDPTYDVVMKEDLVKPEQTETRDFKFRIAYKVLTTRNIDAKIDHTYGRKTDSAVRNVQRTDNSNGNLTWMGPFPGWNLGFDVTRAASDTSGDDQPPDITSTFGFKADYRSNRLSFGTSYKFDKKSLTDNSETFDIKAGLMGPRWDVSLTYSFTKTFSQTLNETYSIGLAFKCNI
jgi:hypothetical protein